ncbi:molybdate ABC transporter permease subunit [Terriglobus sp. RCC_193]|uniref:molybdate ABC transporter permease subunit n=1 Tax=Terriglobus sp. RCC_193 TaxID=3239218 RepID=UPI003523F131
MDTADLLLTLELAAVTTAVLLLLAIPLAGWIAFAHTRLRYFTEALVALPLVLPPTVIGFYLLVGLGPTTSIGRTITSILGHTLAFSFSGLVVGSILYSLPFAVQPIVAGLRSVDPAYLEAAATLGASPQRAFTRIALPLAKSSLLTAAVLTFTHTVGEFGVVLMLGGSIPGRTRTLSIALYNLVENGDFHTANTLALLLLSFSTLALLLLYALPLFRRQRA